MTDLRKMSNEAINERIQFADASQKQLCAEISRAKDGEFGLGLFDVLQEMYNAGYARGAAPSEGMKPGLPTVEQLAQRMAYQHPDMGPEERQRQWGKIPVDNPWRKQWLDTANLVLEFIQSALSPARSGEPPKQDHCFKCGSFDPAAKLSVHAHMLGNHIPGWQNVSDVCSEPYHLAARPSEPSAPQASAEQYIGSDQERVFLEKKALGDFAAPQPVSGDAPKVEEVPLARKAAYALAYADAVAVDEMEAILRPYFPPASQTPQPDIIETMNGITAIQQVQNYLISEDGRSQKGYFSPGGWAYEQLTLISNRLKTLPATPASTARTDRDLRQIEVAEWCAAAFGADQCSVPMRGLRMLEEAIEAYQSATIGLPAEEMKAKAHALVDYVMNRLTGNLAQECGGVGLTLLALCQAAGISAEAEELREIARVKSKPLAHFHQRNQVKNEAGFELAAPGSVPPHDPEKDFRDKFIGNWAGVPQAEPPKEEKP